MIKRGRWWVFEVKDYRKWTLDMAYAYQVAKGYHPAGYGLHKFTVTELDKEHYVMTWECYDSCD